MNWSTWSISAVDERGQQFLFLVYAQCRASALDDVADDLIGLAVVDVHRLH